MAKTLYQDTSHRGYFDLFQNELRNAVAHPVTSDPSSPLDGQFWYRTDLDEFRVQINGSAVALGAGFTQEQIEDIVGAMFSGNTETGIAATYDDAGGKINLVTDALQSELDAKIDKATLDANSVLYATADDTPAALAMGASTILARLAAGNIVAASPAQLRTLLNVEDGATADQTAAEILTALLTVDGSGSGLDADLLDGQSAAYYAVDADVVHDTGAETIAGVKTFSSSPIVPTPSGATDAANKGYVDGLAQGISAKNSVRVATTAAGTLASSFENGDTVDGVTLVTGDRILIKDQAAPAENGIYVVAASGAPARATDFDSAAEVQAGAYVFVEEGTTNADSGWVLTTDGAITLGTTALAFTQFSGAGQITAGAALTKTGNTLDVAVGAGIEVSGDALRIAAAAAGAGLTGGAGSALAVGAGTGITVNADDVAVDTAVVVRKYAVGITGGATSEVITHNLGTRNVSVVLRNNSAPYDEVGVENEATSTNTVTLKSPVNLPAGYIATVMG